MADIPSVADLLPERKGENELEGEKVKIASIFNLPILVTGWYIGPSKKKNGTECLKMQFVRDGETEKHVVFTGSTVMIKQIREIEAELVKRGLPRMFRTVVKNIDDYYKFVSE